nr:helix-turn-helix transcriptional regulator [Geomicrobium sp. JCM 19037]
MSVGLGKKRSKFGQFIDKHSISQTDLSVASGVNRNTISRLCKDSENAPSIKNGSKLLNTLREEGYDVNFEDFWG